MIFIDDSVAIGIKYIDIFKITTVNKMQYLDSVLQSRINIKGNSLMKGDDS